MWRCLLVLDSRGGMFLVWGIWGCSEWFPFLHFRVPLSSSVESVGCCFGIVTVRLFEWLATLLLAGSAAIAMVVAVAVATTSRRVLACLV